jgi:hypothetical protein
MRAKQKSIRIANESREKREVTNFLDFSVRYGSKRVEIQSIFLKEKQRILSEL